jgi:hypothetical protein
MRSVAGFTCARAAWHDSDSIAKTNARRMGAMLNSTVLEVAIGLSFAYAAVALIASSIYEAMSSLLKLRARSLLDGIKAMLNDEAFVGLAKDLYNHPMINPRGAGSAQNEKAVNFKPSYIDSRHFAVALIELIQKAPGDFVALGDKIETLGNPQLKSLLESFYVRANGSLESMQSAVANWFDAGMDRVSGGYKRNAQLFSFLIALALAALFNIDTFHLFAARWKHPALIASVSTGAATVTQSLADLNKLPVGWETPWQPWVPLGWLVTASSALFGAPFWFDLLNRLTNLRGTGPSPKEAKK